MGAAFIFSPTFLSICQDSQPEPLKIIGIRLFAELTIGRLSCYNVSVIDTTLMTDGSVEHHTE